MTVNSVLDTQYFRCKCGWQGHEDDLRSECTYHGTREEPPEYDAFCPQCSNNWEDMTEVPWCIGCEDVHVLKEGDACAACNEVFLEEVRRP